MYFAKIDSPRRFVGPEGQVLAIYDSCRSFTTYAEVGSRDGGKTVEFVSQPRAYFPDEVHEISSGGHYA